MSRSFGGHPDRGLSPSSASFLWWCRFYQTSVFFPYFSSSRSFNAARRGSCGARPPSEMRSEIRSRGRVPLVQRGEGVVEAGEDPCIERCVAQLLGTQRPHRPIRHLLRLVYVEVEQLRHCQSEPWRHATRPSCSGLSSKRPFCTTSSWRRSHARAYLLFRADAPPCQHDTSA